MRLPQQLQHPNHPGHTLSLRSQSTSRKCKCCVCGDSTSSTWAYACEGCRFYMHPKCSGMEHRGAIVDLLVPTQQDDPYINLLSHYNDTHNYDRHVQLPSILDRVQLHNMRLSIHYPSCKLSHKVCLLHLLFVMLKL